MGDWFWCLGHPLVGGNILVYMQKSAGICTVTVLLLEASRIALSMLDGNEEAHANMYTCNTGYPLTRLVGIRVYISTGIYRCSILDIDTKFCENSKQSRISADKRSSIECNACPPSVPRPQLARASVGRQAQRY